MPGSISHANMLFTPPGPSGSRSEGRSASPTRSESQSALTSLESLTIPVPRKKTVYVELPTISTQEKRRYSTDLSSRPITFEEAFPEQEMQGIIGELEVDAELYYFVKLSDGQAFRFPAKDFAIQHPRLVDEYSKHLDNLLPPGVSYLGTEQKEKDDQLDPFDPTATYVHPTSRVDRPQSRGESVLLSKDVEDDVDEFAIGYEGSESDEDEDSVSDAYDEESDAPLSRRRSARTATSSGENPLPFSPKKTRSKKVPDFSAVLHDDDDDDEGSTTWSPSPFLRRSTRARKADADYEDQAQSSDAYTESVQPMKAKRKPKRGIASRPAYGHFRLVADLDYDSDEDTAPLRAHRGDCAKCYGKPTHVQLLDLRKKKPKKKRARKEEDDFEVSEDDNERIARLGGWVRCLRCPIVAHWGCLAKTQRDEILKAALEKDKAQWLSSKPEDTDEAALKKWAEREPAKRPRLEDTQTTEFICGSCMKGGICYACKEVAIEPDGVAKPQQQPKSVTQTDGPSDINIGMADTGQDTETSIENKVSSELLFRCSLCKRLAHYAHLPLPPDDTEGQYSAVELAEYYQTTNSWRCSDCVSFVYVVDQILAWRPFPEGAVEPKRAQGEVPNYKDALPREYLIKWTDRSYLRIQWVPHMWLVGTSATKLSNFLKNGSQVPLLPEPILDPTSTALDEPVSTFGVGVEETEEDDEGTFKQSSDIGGTPDPLIDAERRIPPAWKVVDRVLDLLLWRPEKRLARYQKKTQRRGGRSRVESESEEEDSELRLAQLQVEREREACYDFGEQPSDDLVERVEDWERRNKRKFQIDDIDLVVWGFFKWNDLNYDNVSWDSPPRPDTLQYAAFEMAMERYIKARAVQVPLLTAKEIKAYENLPKDMFRRKYAFTHDAQPELGQSDQFKLMPFQVDGVNWLCNNWWNRQHCILADEMGLGKTVQIVSFIGRIVEGFKDAYSACPVLVVVPNSTITNWVREFERWAPNLRVVPFYGEAKSREVIRSYELFHEHVQRSTTGLKYHVLVTTYDTITTSKDSAAVFKRTPRWEALVVDEGQRLKGDSSLLFKKLRELNTVHRIILTGTPLNNNIRELFNLMNFLNPLEWNDLKTLAQEYEELTEEKIKELHNRLRPYFLRRIKSEVLQLPPKNEVIVPVSMTPLQKEIYRSLLSQNLDMLRSLVHSAAGSKLNAALKKSNLNNLLMQLRKCLQHPYIVSRDIEPQGLSPVETHEKLVSASAKLVMLQMLLPKLKARGHRVLLFSQFKIALDVVEDYLRGEGYKYLRLDGDTKQSLRQKDMDEFNKPNSDIFIYILSTRAGGVGINLWSADTVIIHDPDFNPHQDLQAIARAHRYGQKKTCLVFKLMVKDSAEERIMQTGKKKLVLDHLIVQKMDDDAHEDMQSILTFGAKALFEEGADQAEHAIHYSENDIDKLIERTETEGEEQTSNAAEGAAFSFAKIWSADKDALEELNEGQPDIQAQQDAWAQTLARIAEDRERAKAQELTGRGVKRRVAPTSLKVGDADDGDSPPKRKKGKGKAKATASDEDNFVASEIESAGSTVGSALSDAIEPDFADLADPHNKKLKGKAAIVDFASRSSSPEPIVLYPTLPARPAEDDVCGLCGLPHGTRQCFMTEQSENLAEYRGILMSHAGDESLEERKAAIAVIDETLHKRGHMHLIYGQPLHIVEIARAPPRPIQHHRVSDPPPRTNGTAVLNGHKPKASKLTNGTSSHKAVAIQRSNDTNGVQRTVPPVTRPNLSSNAVAGPSKRALSPQHASQPATSAKKVKLDRPVCVVCGAISRHSVKACPIVAEGSQKITMEILRLQKNPANAEVVGELQRRLKKAKQREALAASGSGT